LPYDGNGYDYDLLVEMGNKIVEDLNIEIDFSMFNKHHLIRAYSVNFKSGLCSVPINPDTDTLEDILQRAENLESLANDKCLGNRAKKTIMEVSNG
jgi:hypothetical protein